MANASGKKNLSAFADLTLTDISLTGTTLTGAQDLTTTFAPAPDKKSNSGVEEMASLETSTTSIGITGANSFYTYNTNASNNAPAKAATMKVNVVKEDLMNHLYNPNSGEHFYTKDTHEKDVLVSLGWQYEGTGWVAPIESSEPVYRLYNPNAGDHHYTKDVNEKDTLVRIGWNYEGIGWYSAKSNTPSYQQNSLLSGDYVDGLEVFREYNPNAEAAGAHNYTISENENEVLSWLA